MTVYNPGHFGRNQLGAQTFSSAAQANNAYSNALNGGAGQGGNANAPAGSPAAAMNGYGGGYGGGYANGQSGGGQAAPSVPTNYSTSIDAKPIYGQNQINAGMAQRKSEAATQAAGQAAAMRNSLANRGFGNNSAAGMAMQGQIAQQGANAGARSAWEFNNDATKANAQHVLQGQTARANEGLGLANLLENARQANQSNATQQAGMLFSLLNGMGGF